MFIIVCGGAHWGPFKTADAAAKWAASQLEHVTGWSIVKLKEPK